MGLFKKWFEDLAVQSDGDVAQPTQVAQGAQAVAQNFMGQPKNSKDLAGLTAASSQPSLLRKTALNLATRATQTSGTQPAQLKTSTPAVASTFLKSLTPKAPNPFQAAI